MEQKVGGKMLVFNDLNKGLDKMSFRLYNLSTYTKGCVSEKKIKRRCVMDAMDLSKLDINIIKKHISEERLENIVKNSVKEEIASYKEHLIYEPALSKADKETIFNEYKRNAVKSVLYDLKPDIEYIVNIFTPNDITSLEEFICNNKFSVIEIVEKYYKGNAVEMLKEFVKDTLKIWVNWTIRDYVDEVMSKMKKEVK